MSAYLLLAPFEEEDDLSPHPELARAQRVDAAAFMKAALVLGVFPPGSYLTGEARLQAGG